MVIKKDMTIGEVLKENKEAGEKLRKLGLGCVGCPCAMMETLEEGCEAHGLDVEEVLKEL
jgi:hybrid cluster-associated redox disulfide protein